MQIPLLQYIIKLNTFKILQRVIKYLSDFGFHPSG